MAFPPHLSHMHSPSFVHSLGTDEPFDMDLKAIEPHYRFYYDCLMRPNARSVLTALRKTKDLSYSTIACGHGPMLRYNLDDMVGKYKSWSEEAVEKARALVTVRMRLFAARFPRNACPVLPSAHLHRRRLAGRKHRRGETPRCHGPLIARRPFPLTIRFSTRATTAFPIV